MPGASTCRPGARPAGSPALPSTAQTPVRDRLGDQDGHGADPGRAGRVRHRGDWTLLLRPLLPEGTTVPRRDGTEITLEHLARHTSGLPRAPTSFGHDLMGVVGPAPESLRRPGRGGRAGRAGRGAAAAHSGHRGGGVLQFRRRPAGHRPAPGRWAPTATPTSWGEAVLRPLGLVDTVVEPGPEQQVRLAQGHGLFGRPVADWYPRWAGRGRCPAVDRARSARLPPGAVWIPTPPRWPRPSAGPTPRLQPDQPRTFGTGLDAQPPTDR